jgi:hypothetical protein
MLPLLDIYSRELKKYVHPRICSQVLTAALLIIAQSENNLNVNQQMNGGHIVIY